MANYYAFTKNGKPVLGSPIQGSKPRSGKSTPIIPGVDCKVPVEYVFLNNTETFADTDTYQVLFTARNLELDTYLPVALGWFYTGKRFTKASFLKSLNETLGSMVQFKFVGDELFIVKSFVGTIQNAGVNLILD